MLGSFVDTDAVFGVVAVEGGVDVGEADSYGEIEEGMAGVDLGGRAERLCFCCDLVGIEGGFAGCAREESEDDVQVGLAVELVSHGVFE